VGKEGLYYKEEYMKFMKSDKTSIMNYFVLEVI